MNGVERGLFFFISFFSYYYYDNTYYFGNIGLLNLEILIINLYNNEALEKIIEDLINKKYINIGTNKIV